MPVRERVQLQIREWELGQVLELLCMRLLSARKSNNAYDQPSELHFIIAEFVEITISVEIKQNPHQILVRAHCTEKYPLRDSNPRPAD